MTTPRAIVSAYEVPRSDRDSGSRRLFDFVEVLLEDGWQVSFLAANGTMNERDTRRFRQLGVAVHDGARENVRSLFSLRFDLALLAFWTNGARYLQTIRETSPHTRVIVDSVDLHFVREARQLEQSGAPQDADYAARKATEIWAYAAADAVLAVSDDETRQIDELVGEKSIVLTVPDGEDLPASPFPFAHRRGILSVGSFQHSPNVSAVEFLCRDILPRIDGELLAEHPLRIVGNALPDSIRALAAGRPSIQMVGWVPEVEPYFHHSRISVVPLLYGAGTKRKMIQALMTGTPTVTTRIGAEGLGLCDGEHVLLADDAATFAACMRLLLTDERLCARLAGRGREHIVATRGKSVAKACLRAAIEKVLACAPKATDARTPAPPPTGPFCASRVPLRPAPPVRADGQHAAENHDVRLIAFYLPQFHQIPENDAWWGPGFTEWRNVATANPEFPAHDQPQLPADLGFYDLRCEETRQSQADLAREHGISGFCYYHYWFQGKRLLERPFQEVLSSGRPDFPFCLCWANDPWSRRWDGRTQDLLQPQGYSAQDDLDHIRALVPALSDPRAIQVSGRPLFLVYRALDLPDPQRTIAVWRDEASRAGLPGLYLVAVETAWDLGSDATRVGFDAKVFFQPQFAFLKESCRRLPVPGKDGLYVYDYAEVWPRLRRLRSEAYFCFETVCLGWDNTARVGPQAVVLHRSTPHEYGRWLEEAVLRARTLPPGERLVFVNAWNEWAEGCHLEPDLRSGRAYLEETRHVLERCRVTTASPSVRRSFSGKTF